LRRNAKLPGGAKFGLAGAARRVALTAELPLDADLDLESRVAETCRALTQHEAWERISRALDPSALDAARAASSDDAGELHQLVEQSGWPFRERAPGHLVLRLEVGDGSQQASLARRADHGYRLWTNLDVPEDLPPRARLAVELVLLAACRLVRMVRAASTFEGGGSATVWEMVWSARPAPVELKHALAAMSVAYRITADEVQALGDEQLANDYLALRGWSSRVSG
jgi:hypothetical protein